jgi:hypothetical protein
MTEAQQKRKIKSIYRRWLEDEKFFAEIASRPIAEYSDVAEVLRNLGSAIAFAQAMANKTDAALTSQEGGGK